jgi:splicing factor 3B subunit 3
MLIFYEMDLGLNHVVRKYSTPVDKTAHMLIQVPGEPYGPGGIIVVCEGFLVYKKVDHDDRECPIPIRNEQIESRGLFMVCHSTFQSKNVQNSMFFFLIQSEYGDLYKLTMDYTGASVHGLSV